MNSPDKVLVQLTALQRQTLKRLIHTGTHPAAMHRRAAILYKSDRNGSDAWTDQAIAKALDTTCMTVRRVRQQFTRDGLKATLNRKRPTGRQYRKLDEKQEATLVSLTCSKAPKGRNQWTLKLLADKLVELNVVDQIDPATVCRTLKKMNLSHGLSSSG